MKTLYEIDEKLKAIEEKYESAMDESINMEVVNKLKKQFENIPPEFDFNPKMKFGEDEYLQEIKDYITNTYRQHYAKNKFQATEFIIDSGHGTGFCIGNVLKYAQRYGKKGTREDARKDLMKVIHYAIIQLYVHDEDL